MVLCEQNLAQTKFIGRKRMKINKIAMQKSRNNAEIMEKNHEHTHTNTHIVRVLKHIFAKSMNNQMGKKERRQK